MAHFAKINKNNIVEQVIVIDNEDMFDAEGNESEEVGKQFINSIGLEGVWIQTSYNNNLINGKSRGKYASIDDIWDGEKFISPNYEQF
jgi:hypothetical protein